MQRPAMWLASVVGLVLAIALAGPVLSLPAEPPVACGTPPGASTVSIPNADRDTRSADAGASIGDRQSDTHPQPDPSELERAGV